MEKKVLIEKLFNELIDQKYKTEQKTILLWERHLEEKINEFEKTFKWYFDRKHELNDLFNCYEKLLNNENDKKLSGDFNNYKYIVIANEFKTEDYDEEENERKILLDGMLLIKKDIFYLKKELDIICQIDETFQEYDEKIEIEREREHQSHLEAFKLCKEWNEKFLEDKVSQRIKELNLSEKIECLDWKEIYNS